MTPPTLTVRRAASASVVLALALLVSACTDAGAATELPTPSASPTPDPAPVHDLAPGPAPRTARVVMGGDLLWHNTVWFSAAADHRRTGRGDRYDWDPMFAALKPTIESADLAICHAEVPFARPGQPPASFPEFAAPRSIAPWIASMGWDACTTASNHSWDQRYAGLLSTADLLERNGVAHVGTFRTSVERERPVVLTTADEVRIAVVAGTVGLNGFVLPADQQWAVSMATTDGLLAQARAARSAGADIVIVHVHWGTEYSPLPNDEQVALARQLTASADVDLVLGEHAHVVQPITRVNGKWVVYGMGNTVAQNDVTQPATYEGITVDFDFEEGPGGRYQVRRAAYVPTQWNHYRTGSPIRIVAARGSHLASVRRAVNAAGGNDGLVEDRLDAP